MSDIEVMKRAAEAAKKTCEQSGERWTTDEDWMEFQSTSAEADFVRQASPVAVLQLIARLHSAEARCAELQSHQDDYDLAHAGIEAAERDAARYRWLRAVDNDYGRSLLATCGPDKLDKAIDAEIAKEPS